ncbi:MAG: chromosome partitioning protein ParB [Gemmatimonadetes bacterium]|nr:chromosome partitioning protein ParB [Gemmatimonadota bacterium]
MATKMKEKPAPPAPPPVDAAAFRGLVELPRDKMSPWPGLNPRRAPAQEAIEKLAISLATEGQLQNLVLHDTGDAHYWIVSGETRWRAINHLAEVGVTIGEGDAAHLVKIELPVMARVKTFSEARALAVALLENMHRVDLNPIEIARGFARYMEISELAGNRRTQADLAEEFLGSRAKQPMVANLLRLLRLPEDYQELIEGGVLNLTQARDTLLPVYSMPDEQAEEVLARVLVRIRTSTGTGDAVTTAWLASVVDGVRGDVAREMGTASLFGDGEPEPLPSPPTVAVPAYEPDEEVEVEVEEGEGAWAGDEALGAEGDPEPEPASAYPTDEEGQRDYLMRHILTHGPGAERIAELVGTGATALELDKALGECLTWAASASKVTVDAAVGSYWIDPKAGSVTTTSAASRIPRYERSDALIARVRRVMGIRFRDPSEAEAAPAPSHAPAPRPAPARPAPPAPVAPPRTAPAAAPAPAYTRPATPAPAVAPAPVPAAAPVLASPDGARTPIREGAGIVSAIRAATGRRRITLTIAEIADHRVVVTAVAQPAKAGENPLVLQGTEGQVDAQLIAAIDRHFN